MEIENSNFLNYFTHTAVYNPFKDSYDYKTIEDLEFSIPEKPNIQIEEDYYVSVSTGLLTNSLAFLNDCIFAVYDKDGITKIADLTNVIGELGNNKNTPTEKQIFWFNTEGLRGTFYIHKNHCGQILKLVSGIFVNTSITSGVLNEFFIRTSQTPALITEIDKQMSLLDSKTNSILQNADKEYNKYYGKTRGRIRAQGYVLARQKKTYTRYVEYN